MKIEKLSLWGKRYEDAMWQLTDKINEIIDYLEAHNAQEKPEGKHEFPMGGLVGCSKCGSDGAKGKPEDKPEPKVSLPFTIPHWRIGQTISNFLEWLNLNTEKGYATNQATRIADPFHIPDKEFLELWKEFQETR